ncbi:Non-specific lipid transfer protein GPI-anchored 1 [Spatholobus suberectus]|nr:Non-specific lipid transfer protein GPI-anchored 1 [Spatholobus suberectus]
MKQRQQQSRAELLGLGLGLFLLIAGGSVNTANGADDLATKCSQVVDKVIPCLEFATGKEATPKKECCDATKAMKETNPECLCYIIQETHKGSPQIKSLGIQEAKLLQLPSACNVKNASISNCPKLLGLSPSSPDAAIFTNSSKVTPAAANTQTTTTQSQNASYGSMVRPNTVTYVMMMALAIVVVAIPTGFVSIYT